MPDPHPQFSPACPCPIPYILQPEERVEQLKACLQTDFGEAQRVNAEALIRLYESGELGPRQRSDPPVYLIDGQRVDKDSWEDAAKTGIRWCETLEYQQLSRPAIPNILQPEERVEQLKACLQTDFGKAQRVNAEALIRLYESGELGPRQRSDPPVYLIDGQRVDKDSWEDAAKIGIRWCETLDYQQMMSQHEFQPQQMAQSVSETFAYSNTLHMHQLHAQIRISPRYGGIGNLTRPFLVCNDTGSNVLTLFSSDLQALQFNMVLHIGAMRGVVQVTTANGPAFQHSMVIDMQILTSAFVPLTPWFEERAIVKPDSPGDVRLSGKAMRDYLFFATSPGNAHLYVAQKKAGIIRDLPA